MIPKEFETISEYVCKQTRWTDGSIRHDRMEDVVRCKDCIVFGTHGKNTDICPMWHNTHIDPYRDFCSRGVRKTENSSEKPNNCKYAENPSGDVWECGCFLDTYCEHQIYDRNPDGTINIVKCGYDPKDEPQTDGILFKGHLKEGDYKLIKTTNGWVLEGDDIAYCGEPQTNADQHVQRVEYVGNDEKSHCWECKYFERMYETPTASDGKYFTYVICTASECRFEPKTEPQTERSE